LSKLWGEKVKLVQEKPELLWVLSDGVVRLPRDAHDDYYEYESDSVDSEEEDEIADEDSVVEDDDQDTDDAGTGG